MSYAAAFEDAFNLLCGDKLGEGVHRTVFECRLLPDLVVKVEKDTVWRYFANVHEMAFWSEYQHKPAIAQHLAPCKWLSPDGRILLQSRAAPLAHNAPMPTHMPHFLGDFKRCNFGTLDSRLVCVDYAIYDVRPRTSLVKVTWDSDDNG